MEDRRLPITVGQGAGARVVTLELPPFTLIGATTRAGLLTTPLRDRFGIQARLEPYSHRGAGGDRRARGADPRGRARRRRAPARSRARSRGTPRVANRLLKRARDYAEVRGDGTVTAAAAQAALELLEVDELGLDRLDREILRAICEKFGGGPVGLVDARRSRSARSATRSRTSTSPTCSSSGCSSARRAGGSRPRTPTRTSRSRRRRRRRRCSELPAPAPVVADAPPVGCRRRWLTRSSAPTAASARWPRTATRRSAARSAAARTAASRSSSSCSTTTTRRRTRRSSSPTARAA